MNDSLQDLPSLYQLPSTARCFLWAAVPAIASAVGSGASILGSIFGGGKSDAYEDAANQRLLAAQQAQQRMDNAKQAGLGYLDDYLYGGYRAMAGLENLYSPTGSKLEWLEKSPIVQSLMRSAIGGTEEDPYSGGLPRYLSATGQTGSGMALKAASKYAQDIALQNAINPYRADMTTMYSGGLKAGEDMANLEMQAAKGIGDYGIAGAGGYSDAMVRAANAANEQSALNSNNLFSSLGVGIGALGKLASVLGQGYSNTSYSPYSGSGWSSNYGSYANSLPSAQYLQSIGSGLGGGLYGGGASAFGNLMPGKARGGALPAGQFAVVGERGPEIVRFFQDGYVIPNHMLRRYALAA